MWEGFSDKIMYISGAWFYRATDVRKPPKDTLKLELFLSVNG
jgi:hypothetical protein